ncbi:hypothetical protein BTN50_0491 [Candidatus Enterovibrio altilux]|uniref:Uncharacterized protein n=1 Tax=Candidatus Enterovibrio altilux TaxID=1927128 RepID=A0A291B7Q6_9GAMM|nr:hypothetical protein BTN50_0491 [Candidatus Enterovibrio luxaltus]
MCEGTVDKVDVIGFKVSIPRLIESPSEEFIAQNITTSDREGL